MPESPQEMAARADRDHVIRLELWLAGRQANVHPEISTTNVRAEPYDRTSSSYTLAESDLRALLDEAEELRSDVDDLAEELDELGAEMDELNKLPALLKDARALAQAMFNRLRDYVSDEDEFGDGMSWATLPDWISGDETGREMWKYGADDEAAV